MKQAEQQMKQALERQTGGPPAEAARGTVETGRVANEAGHRCPCDVRSASGCTGYRITWRCIKSSLGIGVDSVFIDEQVRRQLKALQRQMEQAERQMKQDQSAN